MARKITLDGLNGLVYIMFLGRETYISEWDKKIVNKFTKNKPSIDQAAKRLLKTQSIRNVKTRTDLPGAPKIRTANYEPILKITSKAIKHVNLSKERLIFLIENLSWSFNEFPEYYYTILSAANQNPMKINQTQTVSAFLGFLGQIYGIILIPELSEIQKDTEEAVSSTQGKDKAPEVNIIFNIAQNAPQDKIQTLKNDIGNNEILQDLEKLQDATGILLFGVRAFPLMKKLTSDAAEYNKLQTNYNEKIIELIEKKKSSITD